MGVPMDLGAGRRGVDMGPSAIRMTRFVEQVRKLGYEVRDFGDIHVPLPEECHFGDATAKYAVEIDRVCRALEVVVRKVLEEQHLPIVLGGDHSLAMGSIAGVSRHYSAQSKAIGLLWIDAHGDMNTPSSTPSGNVHGMPFSKILGMWALPGRAPERLVESARACLIGVRDLDEREKGLIAESGVRVFTMKDIDRRGMGEVMDEALKVALDGTAGVHVSFDIDALDPQVAPGVGTPKKGGLDYREAHLCMEMVADSGRLIGLDMVEVNPILDTRNSTAELAAELILSALGKSIF